MHLRYFIVGIYIYIYIYIFYNYFRVKISSHTLLYTLTHT